MRQQKGADQHCKFHPRHTESLEDCTFCSSSYYPCEDEIKLFMTKGTKTRSLFDCSKCKWIHSHKTVKEIHEKIGGKYINEVEHGKNSTEIE